MKCRVGLQTTGPSELSSCPRFGPRSPHCNYEMGDTSVCSGQERQAAPDDRATASLRPVQRVLPSWAVTATTPGS